MSQSLTSDRKDAGPMRRLGAMFYDSLLLIAVLMVVSAAFLVATMGRLPDSNPALLLAYRAVLLIAVVCFFGFFWTRKGCTLGMQVWKLRIETEQGALPGWREALSRLAWALTPWIPALIVIAVGLRPDMPSFVSAAGIALLALVPLNYLSGYWTAQRRPWHERRLTTRIVLRK